MQVRNLSLQTQATYVQQVSLFARHFNKSPEILGPEEIRSYQVYLTNERKLAPSSIIIAVAALRFLYKITLHRAWNLEEVIPTPKKPQKLPMVLTQEEVLKFLASVRNIKHRTILTTCYARLRSEHWYSLGWSMRVLILRLVALELGYRLELLFLMNGS